jgi:hypothetical protein
MRARKRINWGHSEIWVLNREVEPFWVCQAGIFPSKLSWRKGLCDCRSVYLEVESARGRVVEWVAWVKWCEICVKCLHNNSSVSGWCDSSQLIKVWFDFVQSVPNSIRSRLLLCTIDHYSPEMDALRSKPLFSKISPVQTGIVRYVVIYLLRWCVEPDFSLWYSPELSAVDNERRQNCWMKTSSISDSTFEKLAYLVLKLFFVYLSPEISAFGPERDPETGEAFHILPKTEAPWHLGSEVNYRLPGSVLNFRNSLGIFCVALFKSQRFHLGIENSRSYTPHKIPTNCHTAVVSCYRLVCRSQ